MAKYGITFDVSGKSIEQMKEIERSLQKLGVTAKVETDKVESSVEHLSESFDKLQRRIVEVFALEKVKEFAEEVLHVTAEFEGFENRIKFASVDITDATQNMQFLRDEVTQLHIPIRQVYEGFSEMESGLRGTGVEGERLRKLFEGISVAAATLHLPEYQLQRTLYDLKEIGEIGINQRIARSLSTALPGIGGIVQKTFGKSMRELEKEGISGADFLNKLGPALLKNFSSGLENYSQSLQARMADTSNKFYQSQVDLGEKLKPVYMHIMDGLIDGINSVNNLIDYLDKHQEIVKGAAKAVEILVIAWGSYVAITKAAAVVTAAQAAVTSVLTVAEYAAAFGVDGLIFALESLNIAFASTAIGVFSLAVGVLVQQFMSLSAEADEYIEKLTRLKELAGPTNLSGQHFADINAEMAAPNLSDTDRGRILTQLKQYKQADVELQQKMEGNLTLASAKVRETVKRLSHGKTDDYSKLSPYLKNQMVPEIEGLAGLRGQLYDVTAHIAGYEDLERQLKGQGVKQPKYTNLMDPTGDAALKTTRLSGAEGGLGQAKQINIKIDTVMRVENHDNNNLVHHAELAADQIIRVANNFAESQTGSY